MTSSSFTQRALCFSLSVFIGTVALAATAHAQAPNAARLDKARTELQKRFDAADANRDGKLTREEAQAKMPRIYKNFDAIDTAHAGTISLADIETFLVSKKGSRKPAG
ncbi:EF-hand domain-containing protein [Polaromonas sp. YR568]|uniref:EF-hand domain-containing protein n=1 Tax=Polaromonas sp. YR568 TaxID=1855301 RepID=UPI00398BC8E5